MVKTTQNTVTVLLLYALEISRASEKLYSEVKCPQKPLPVC